MVLNDRTGDIGIVVSGLATAGSALLAGYLLFTEVTTQPGTTEPATGLESGNPYLIGLSILPIVLSVVGLVGAYYGRPEALVVGGIILLLLGVIGINVGFFYLAIGLLLLMGYVLISY